MNRKGEWQLHAKSVCTGIQMCDSGAPRSVETDLPYTARGSVILKPVQASQVAWKKRASHLRHTHLVGLLGKAPSFLSRAQTWWRTPYYCFEFTARFSLHSPSSPVHQSSRYTNNTLASPYKLPSLQARLYIHFTQLRVLTVRDCEKWNRLSTRESLGNLKMILTLSGSSGEGSGGRHSSFLSFSSCKFCRDTK